MTQWLHCDTCGVAMEHTRLHGYVCPLGHTQHQHSIGDIMASSKRQLVKCLFCGTAGKYGEPCSNPQCSSYTKKVPRTRTVIDSRLTGRGAEQRGKCMCGNFLYGKYVKGKMHYCCIECSTEQAKNEFAALKPGK